MISLVKAVSQNSTNCIKNTELEPVVVGEHYSALSLLSSETILSHCGQARTQHVVMRPLSGS